MSCWKAVMMRRVQSHWPVEPTAPEPMLCGPQCKHHQWQQHRGTWKHGLQQPLVNLRGYISSVMQQDCLPPLAFFIDKTIWVIQPQNEATLVGSLRCPPPPPYWTKMTWNASLALLKVEHYIRFFWNSLAEKGWITFIIAVFRILLFRICMHLWLPV